MYILEDCILQCLYLRVFVTTCSMFDNRFKLVSRVVSPDLELSVNENITSHMTSCEKYLLYSIAMYW